MISALGNANLMGNF